MIALRCTQCGGTSPLSLHQPDEFECPFCHTHQPLPLDVHVRLDEARFVLGQIDRVHLQLSHTQRQALEEATAGRFFLIAFLATLTTPSLFIAGFCSQGYAPVPHWLQTAIAYGPAGLTLAAGIWSLFELYRARPRLEAACTASPPLAPGDSARCHVCGGPLRTEPGQVIARCEFCHADSIVTDAALDRFRDHLRFELDDFVGAIYRETYPLRHLPARTTIRIIAVALAAPLAAVGLILLLGVYAHLTGWGRANDSIEYVLFPFDATHDGSTLCWVAEAGDYCVGRKHGQWVDFASAREHLPDDFDLELETIRASQLVGRKVRLTHRVGTVIQVLGEANTVIVDVGDGDTIQRSPTEICLVPAER